MESDRPHRIKVKRAPRNLNRNLVSPYAASDDKRVVKKMETTEIKTLFRKYLFSPLLHAFK